jgi:hypothetical protein
MSMLWPERQQRNAESVGEPEVARRDRELDLQVNLESSL